MQGRFKQLFSAGWFYYWLVALFLYFPILMLVVFSFNDSTNLRFPLTGFTVGWYQQLFEAGELLQAVVNSIWVGLWSSIVATILGTMAAIAVIRFDDFVGYF